jgi:hypothetical protein
LKFCRKSNDKPVKCIAKAVVGNRSSTAAQFQVSSQKSCYDFNFKKDLSKPIVCLNILACNVGVCIHQQCATNLNKLIFILKLDVNPILVILHYLYVDIFLKQYIIH